MNMKSTSLLYTHTSLTTNDKRAEMKNIHSQHPTLGVNLSVKNEGGRDPEGGRRSDTARMRCCSSGGGIDGITFRMTNRINRAGAGRLMPGDLKIRVGSGTAMQSPGK